ncbi:carbohydrate kinase family protein [Actinomycetota bacterium]
MAKVACLGIQIMDILGRPVTGIPEGQNVDLLEEIRITVAGTAGGTCVDLAKLGAEVFAMGAIGEDEIGNFLLTTMQRYGINTSGLKRKSGVQTSSSMLPIRPNGDRPSLHVLGANGELVWEDIDLDLIASADYFHMGGTSLLPKFDGEPTRKVLEFAKQNGAITTFDLVALERPDLLDLIEPCLPFVDYFMPGLEEAVMMCGSTDRQEVIRFFLERGAGHTVFKMGDQGSSVAYLENGKINEKRIPSFKVPVVDSTGCGDSYCAGFIIGISMGWDLEKAARLGTAAGGLVIQGLGSDAGIVDLDQTIDFMEKAEELPMSK